MVNVIHKLSTRRDALQRRIDKQNMIYSDSPMPFKVTKMQERNHAQIAELELAMHILRKEWKNYDV